MSKRKMQSGDDECVTVVVTMHYDDVKGNKSGWSCVSTMRVFRTDRDAEEHRMKMMREFVLPKCTAKERPDSLFNAERLTSKWQRDNWLEVLFDRYNAKAKYVPRHMDFMVQRSPVLSARSLCAARKA